MSPDIFIFLSGSCFGIHLMMILWDIRDEQVTIFPLFMILLGILFLVLSQ